MNLEAMLIILSIRIFLTYISVGLRVFTKYIILWSISKNFENRTIYINF